MTSKWDFADEVVGRLLPFGPVSARRMFGGFGIYVDGVMFGLIGFDELYFKVDDGNRDDYLSAGAGPFTYRRGQRRVEMSYYRVPDEVFADGGTLAEWAEGAYQAARRAKGAKRLKARRTS